MQRMYDNRQNCMSDKPTSCDTNITELPYNVSVAMAYIPFQTNTETYDESKALCEGTLYPVLNKPFFGGCFR